MPDILTLQATSAHPTLTTAFYTVMVSILLSVMVAMTYCVAQGLEVVPRETVT